MKNMSRYTYKITYLDPRNLRPRDIFCSIYSKTTRGCKDKIRDFMEKEVKNWEGAYETKLVDEIKVIHRSDVPEGIVYVMNKPI